MEYKELTERIIGCSYRVYNRMGFGFLESVYEKCMLIVLIELRKARLNAESQKPITVYYENEIVGEFVADIIVNDTIILELKSVRQIINAHEVQLVNYLVATGKPVGLVINFGERKVEIKRKIKDLEKFMVGKI
ncbi:MAG: GxxExxY protein [Candidatus Jettenia sp.]|uniref:GxxExxY protein n=1 Tax=Candidatus Jettenia caeni TaxID=247490 RepID=I3IMD4_9BACT|nr:GxxExxY protein [Candidatus Jettenia sp. AMX1]MBC6927758.1 GxxExxY protein [Candidatus Jettenia sp.]NUN21953.1 GxxExxY protein [Candidatus Jettenia caeni]KAA0251441.1 MAG: GxxExxY protein [Candidatus Jettenia sp. AMX1]MCE7879424.1 GxxExxY protein [Candidatus Jettenia sp. AMX1]MDL1938373.1 GxxExxY protein [Candidatus Jettenia sp. AMX1]